MCFQLFVNFVWKTQGKKNNWMSPFFLNTNFIWFKHKQNSDWSIQKKQLDVDLLLNKNFILCTDTTMLVYSKCSFRELIRVKRKGSDSILWKKNPPYQGIIYSWSALPFFLRNSILQSHSVLILNKLLIFIFHSHFNNRSGNLIEEMITAKSI